MQKKRQDRNVITSYSIHYTKLYDAGFPATEAEYSARALSAGIDWDMTAPWTLDQVYSSPNIRSLIPADWTSGKNLFIVVKPIEFAENNYKEYKAKTAGQDVITSYSIHYTKLYDKTMLPFLCKTAD